MTRQREMNLEFSPLKTGDHRVPRPRQWHPWPTPPLPCETISKPEVTNLSCLGVSSGSRLSKGRGERKEEEKVKSQMRKEETEVAATTTGAPNSSNLVLPAGTPISPPAETPKTACPFPAPLPTPMAPATPPGSSSWYPSSLFECNCIQAPFPHPCPLSCSSPFFSATSSLPSHPLFPSCWWRTRDLTQVSLPKSVT